MCTINCTKKKSLNFNDFKRCVMSEDAQVAVKRLVEKFKKRTTNGPQSERGSMDKGSNVEHHTSNAHFSDNAFIPNNFEDLIN